MPKTRTKINAKQPDPPDPPPPDHLTAPEKFFYLHAGYSHDPKAMRKG